MKRYVIEREIPGASELSEAQLAEIAAKSNDVVASLGVPYRWITSYVAGDKIHFQLERAGHDFLLRFDNDPETFVLYADRTSMGGRVLKYDSGETAIRVANWGALTLYTDGQPNGLPAMRSGDAPSLSATPVSVQNVQFLAAQEAARLGHVRHLHIAFVVDWSVLETDSGLCAAANNALENAARGIERYAHDSGSRKELTSHVRTVTLATGRKPTLTLQDRTLIVTFNPERGYSGCASSRAIARQLADLLTATKKAQIAGRG